MNWKGDNLNFKNRVLTLGGGIENYAPRLVNRAARNIWEKSGGKTLTQVANEKVRDIIKYHEPVALPKGIAAKIRDIVENAVGHMPGEDE